MEPDNETAKKENGVAIVFAVLGFLVGILVTVVFSTIAPSNPTNEDTTNTFSAADVTFTRPTADTADEPHAMIPFKVQIQSKDSEHYYTITGEHPYVKKDEPGIVFYELRSVYYSP